jgi:hypothetical protein
MESVEDEGLLFGGDSRATVIHDQLYAIAPKDYPGVDRASRSCIFAGVVNEDAYQSINPLWIGLNPTQLCGLVRDLKDDVASCRHRIKSAGAAQENIAYIRFHPTPCSAPIFEPSQP